jgi:hypothetical protein
MDKKRYVYFDIETVGKYKDYDTMVCSDLRQSELFEKKCKRFKEKDPSWEGPVEEVFLKKCGLYPEYAKVACVSYAYYTADGELHINSFNDLNEEVLLTGAKNLFLSAIKRNLILCGFNIKNFDIPFLFKKFLHYGITPPENVNFFNKKPWEVNCLDLMDLWKSNSTLMVTTFDEFAYMLHVDSPKDKLDGSEVHDAYYNKQEYGLIREYCEKDVRCCAECVSAIEGLL